MKRNTLLFAAGAAAILLSGKKKRSAPSIPEEVQEEPEIEDTDSDPEPDTVPEPDGFQCERMLYNGYCIETREGTPSALFAAWSLKIRDADGVKVYSALASFTSEGEALDHAYSKIDGWT